MDFSGRGKKSNKNTRKPYSDDDIQKLLGSPNFTNNFEKTLQKTPEWHWIVLLALTTGARLTETCQLRTYDINIEAKTIQFQETEEDENSLKNLNSTRTIPISNFVIQCGFLEYVKHQQKTVGNRTVLWGWNKTRVVEQYGWGRYFGKRFNVYNRSHITQENLKSFHSFRHTVITNLNRYLPELNIVITRFVGHAHQSVNLNTYTHTQWEEKMLTVANHDIYPMHFERLDKLRLKLARFWFSLEQEE